MVPYRYPLILSLLTVLCATFVLAQAASTPVPYDDPEAYKVYSAILPHDSTAHDQKVKTFVIRVETEPFPDCIQLADDASASVKGAIADYKNQNVKKWSLQRSFDLDQTYLMISSDEINRLFAGTRRRMGRVLRQVP